MSDLCVRCQSKPASRAISVEVLQFSDAIRIEGKDHVVESSWCVRLCEDCSFGVHSSIKRQTQFAQAKFKIGDVVSVKKGCENGWPFKERHTVTWVNVDYAVPLYGLDSIGCACPETILEARSK